MLGNRFPPKMVCIQGSELVPPGESGRLEAPGRIRRLSGFALACHRFQLNYRLRFAQRRESSRSASCLACSERAAKQRKKQRKKSGLTPVG
jgi:hypothetical protein